MKKQKASPKDGAITGELRMEPTWGGARPGSGRKPGVRTAEPKIMVNVRLTAAEREKALKIGDGNASAGLREALRRARV